MKPTTKKFFAELSKQRPQKINLNIASDLHNYIEETYSLSNEIEENTNNLKDSARIFVEIYTKLEMEYGFLKEYETSLNDKYQEGQRMQENLYNILEEIGADALDSELYQDVSKAVDTLEGSNHVVQEMESILREVENYIN